MRKTVFWIFLSLFAATGACGKKGPLYLPEEKAQTDAANKDAASKDAGKDAGGKDAPPANAPASQPAPANPPR